MDVPRKDSRKTSWDVPSTHDLGATSKGIVRNANRSALHNLMHTQQTKIRLHGFVTSLCDQQRKSFAHIPRIRKSRNGNPFTSDCQLESPWLIKNIQVGMSRPEVKRDTRSLMISWHEVDWDTPLGHFDQWLHGHVD